MKILHALAQRPGRTGSGVFLQQLFKAGHEKGYKQAVIAGVPLNEQDPCIDNLDINNFYPVLFESKNLPFSVVGMSDVMPYKSTKYSEINETMLKQYEKEFKRVIIKAIEEFKPDVIISNHIWLLSTFIKDLYPNIKTLVLCHGTDLRQLELSPSLATIVKEKIHKCDYVFALNSVQAQTIKKLYKLDDTQVITSGSGYNPEMFYPIKRERNKKVKISYVGKICNAKGVPHLINAIENTKNLNKIELNLIGKGNAPESEEILSIIKNKKAKINYLGALPQKELENTLRFSDVFILPSFFEGLPLVVIEALASGAKVIATDLPGLDDFLGEEFKNLDAIRYIKMPRLKTVDEPLDEDIQSFEEEIITLIDEVSSEIINDKEYKIDEVMKLLEDKTWKGLFNRLEKSF